MKEKFHQSIRSRDENAIDIVSFDNKGFVVMSQLLESDLSSLRDWMVKGRFSIDRYTKKRERKTHKKRAIMEHNHDPMRIRLQHSKCLKFIEKVSFNIASEASYVYILNG